MLPVGADIVLLTGAAGTGKTTLVREILAHLDAQGFRYVLMAPTGRAAKVLAERGGRPAATIHRTIYQAEALLEHFDGEGGATTFKWVFNLKSNSDDANTVYIVDEASMVSDAFSEDERFRFGSGRLLSDLMRYADVKATNNNRRIIFVGDPAQLPPVGSIESPALCGEYLAERFGVTVRQHGLTRIYRQGAGSGILENAMRIRAGIEERQYAAFRIDAADDVELLKQDRFLARYREVTLGRPCPGALVVAYSNELVRQYNRMIRQVLFPKAEGPVAGDHLLVVQNNYRLAPVLFNGDFVVLLSVSDDVITQSVVFKADKGIETVKLSFRRASVRLIDDDKAQEVMLIEDLLNTNEPMLGDKQQDALYVNFKMRYPLLKPSTEEFMAVYRTDPFVNALRVKYGYAVTCHKAQGGEWPTVFVDYSRGSGQFTEDYFRWAYTATTRAKERLFALDAPNRSVLTARNNIKVDTKEGVSDVVVASVAGASPIEFTVKELLLSAGFSVSMVHFHNYHDIYVLSSSQSRARVKVVYTARNAVTCVEVLPHDSEIAPRVHEALDNLVGKRILSNRDCADAGAGRQADVALGGHLSAFDQALRSEALGRDIKPLNVTQLTEYQLRYTFSRDGHECVVVYSLNKGGSLTDVRPVKGRTTHEGLLKDILDLTEGVLHD